MARNVNEIDALHCAARDGSLDCLTHLISQGMNTDTHTKEGDTLLHLAAYGGSLSMVQYIYETFPELKNKKNEKGQDALYRAVRGGNLDCLKYLIDQGMNTDTRSKYGHTLLHAAAYGGIVSIVKYILDTYPYMINKTDEKGMDGLFSAARGGSLDCLIYLIGKGMTMDTRSKYGSTILHSAAYVRSVPVVQYICETFPDLIEERNKKGQDALHSAALGGSIDCLKYLIGQGLTPDTRSKMGNTLLHTAVYGGSVRMVKYVWDTFPKLQNERNQQGKDATFIAVHGYNLDCLKYLISHGLKPDTRSKTGNTLLHTAVYGGSVPMVQYVWETFPKLRNKRNQKGKDASFSAVHGNSLGCLKYLISHGMNINTRSTNGHTLFEEAAYKGIVPIVKYLCETFGKLKNGSNQKGTNALFSAVRGGSLVCVKYLISYGMNTNNRTKEGDTLLHVAAYGGPLSMVQYMYETFPMLKNKRNEKGHDALYRAALGGNLDCLKYLIVQGMNTDTRSKYGHTVLHAAIYRGNLSMVKYIFETSSMKNETDEKGMAALFSAVRYESFDCLIYLISQYMKSDTLFKYGSTVLHEAAFKGWLSMVQHICKTFPDLKNERNQKGMDILLSAVGGGSLDCLKYLISQGLNTDTRSTNGNTLLHIAANCGFVPIVQYLCETFPDLIKERNMKGQDALHSAALGGSLDCLKYLIGQGLRPETRSKTGNTLLHTAVYGGSVPMVQFVWETFPTLHNKRNQEGKNASFSAVYGKSLDCLKYLISHGMNTHTRSKNGPTIFEEAAYEGIVPMLEYLCQAFAGWKHLENQKGTNALFRAVRGGSLVCLKYLISQGMKTNTRTKYGETILHVAAYAGSESIVQHICETFPEMKYEVNTKGEDSLHSATRGGSLSCLIYLIDQEMTIFSLSKNEETILHQAAYHGHEGIVRYICENYVQLLIYKQNRGRTALYSAVNGGHLDMLKYLLSQIDPKQTDKRGQTILHAAAWTGKPAIVRYLCTTFKFLISVNGYKGETAIDLAQRNGHLDCMKIIQEQL